MFEIGTTLREARVRRALTLQQAEEDTKIRVKYLQAMENEDFDLMPGPTYAKAFLRTYATYLGLDANVMLQEYSSRGAGAQRDHEPFGGSSMLGAPRSHRGRNTLVFIAVICLLVVGVIYVLGLGNDPGDRTPIDQPSALGINSPSPKPSHTATPTKSATPLTDEVRINARTGDCWLEVRVGSSSGKVLYASTLQKGATKVFKGKKLWLRLGNPGSLVIRVGGNRIDRITLTGPLDYLAQDGKLTKAV